MGIRGSAGVTKGLGLCGETVMETAGRRGTGPYEGAQRRMRGESCASGGGSGPLVAPPSTLFEVRGGENRGALSLELQRRAGRSVNKCGASRRGRDGGQGTGGGLFPSNGRRTFGA